MQIAFRENTIGQLTTTRASACAEGVEMQLGSGDLLRLEKLGPSAAIRAVDGVLWISQEGDPKDYVLQSGQSMALRRRGLVLVGAIGCGKIQIVNG